MPSFPSKSLIPCTTYFYCFLSLVLILSCGTFIVTSWHWPLVGDAPLLHYVVFLMQHGRAPYKDIVDLNQPGTYAVEAAVMWFGKDALAWRIFDLILLGVISAAMLVLCQTKSRFRGRFSALFAAAIFALVHGRDGLIQLGQRDLIMSALLASAFALFVKVVRAGQNKQFKLSFLAGLALEQRAR